MITKQTIIVNQTGLHARPASDFVVKAKGFCSNITLRNLDTENPPVNAKSILMLLGEGIENGTRVEITAEGIDEKSAIISLVDFIENGLNEQHKPNIDEWVG